MRRLSKRAQPFRLPGYPDFLASLLFARGVRDAEGAARFLNPSLDQLRDPFSLSGMDEACGLIRKAAEEKWVVAVYGDYDADGICATAILLEALETLDVRAFSYIPDRQAEGYGLNLEAVESLAGQAQLLLSADCGVTGVEEVLRAKQLGMRVIITDHHALPEQLPEADALIHPLLPDAEATPLCGAGVVWKLACALLGVNRAEKSLDLAAVATVADLVPLTGENRVITALGLEKLRATRKPGLQALMRVAGMKEGAPVNAEQVAFQLAPRLNAGGRLSTAADALQLLTTPGPMEADTLARRLDALNRERKDVEARALREASAQLQGVDLSLLRSVVVAGEGWNPGVVGLVAGKLAERWNYPTLALALQGDELTGSGRSAGGIDLHRALKDCEDLLTRFGGHRMAAGLALKKGNLDALKERFDQAVRSQLGGDDLIPETAYDDSLELGDVTLETARALGQLAPFGVGNPSPLFLMEGLNLLSSRAVGASGAHLRLTVARNGAVREGIAFNQGGLDGNLPRELRLVGAVDENDFNGRFTAQLKVRAVLPGSGAFSEEPVREARAALKTLAACAGPGDGEVTVEEIESPPHPEGARGTLLIARCAETANRLAAEMEGFSALVGGAPDPRGFNALVLSPDWSQPFARFDRVVFLDGLLCPGEAKLAQKAAGGAAVLAMPQSPGLIELMQGIRLGVDELREAYVRLRDGGLTAMNLSPSARQAALMVLSEMGLVSLDGHQTFLGMLPARRADPEDSPLFRALRGS